MWTTVLMLINFETGKEYVCVVRLHDAIENKAKLAKVKKIDVYGVYVMKNILTVLMIKKRYIYKKAIYINMQYTPVKH